MHGTAKDTFRKTKTKQKQKNKQKKHMSANFDWFWRALGQNSVYVLCKVRLTVLEKFILIDLLQELKSL